MRGRAPRRSRPRPARAIAAIAALLGGLLLGGCGDTLQTKPIPHNILEGMVLSPFPVYWLGERFEKLQITEASKDASGAFSVQYGNCLQGGQGTCTPPLRIVTSPDNGFVPGGATPSQPVNVRGVQATLTNAGRTIAIPTGGVVVSIFGSEAASARAAAEGIVAINRPSAPGEALPARLPDTGFGSTPLPSQLPSQVKALG